MRVIKFRVWDKELKKMHVCGEDVHDSIGFIRNQACYYNLQNGCGSLPDGNGTYELMQYTGLKDKNGKEIYEGDILEAEHKLKTQEFKRKYQVIFNENGYWDAISLDGKPVRLCYAGFDKCKVIGNIYENQELLEGE